MVMIKKEFATIKERRAVADLLAIKAGRAARGPEDITAAANMSDAEIKQYLKDNTPAAVVADPEQKDNYIYLDKKEVDEIQPGGGGSFELYDVAKNTIDNYITAQGWDPEKITPIQWGAVMMGCGRAFRSLFRGSPDVTPNNRNKSINIDAAAAAVPVWLELCTIYNKVPFKSDFCAFVGMDSKTLYALGVTPGSIDLNKRLDEINADYLRKRAIDPRVSPVGAIFLLKADHGLVEATKVQHEYIKDGQTGGALPDFGSFTAINDENGQK